MKSGFFIVLLTILPFIFISCEDDESLTCNNGIVEMDEDCDGANLLGYGCRSIGQGFTSGTLGCTSKCIYDTSNCAAGSYCGDDVCDADENITDCYDDCAVANGTLVINAETITYYGVYAPANCTAIWIQKPNGDFIQTLFIAEQWYGIYLTKWWSISSGDKTDAVSQASRFTHGAISATWNLVDVPFGTYEFWVEYTENNGTGLNTFGTIEINDTGKSINGTSTTYIKNLTALFTPSK
jgi:hypothetical protein